MQLTITTIELIVTLYFYRGLGVFWIGYNDRDNEGDFVWLTGVETCYENWQSGQPNDALGQDCTVILNNGQWFDYACADLHSYVCEGNK